MGMLNYLKVNCHKKKILDMLTINNLVSNLITDTIIILLCFMNDILIDILYVSYY